MGKHPNVAPSTVIALLAVLLLPWCPASCAASATRYDPLPNSSSPRGTFELVYAMKNRSKVDWEKLDYRNPDRDVVLGKDDQNVEVLVLRRNDSTVVQRIPGITYWRAAFRTGEPVVSWSPDEQAAFIYILGYWTNISARITRIHSTPKNDTADLLPVLTTSIDKYMRRHFPKYFYQKGYHYTFIVEQSRFRPDKRLEMNIHAQFPRAALDWFADGRVVIDLGPTTRRLRPVVTGVILIEEKPGPSPTPKVRTKNCQKP